MAYRLRLCTPHILRIFAPTQQRMSTKRTDAVQDAPADEEEDTQGAAPDETGAGEDPFAGEHAAAGPPVEQQPDADLDSLRDRHLRLAAEYDNYRKRTERERGERWQRAQAQLIERLLEPLDDLQRVADFDPETTSAAALLEGVQLVERKMLRTLDAAGLKVIDPVGERFDPAFHEALTMTPTDDPEQDETVGEVFQKGYELDGVLIRPARVVVRQAS